MFSSKPTFHPFARLPMELRDQIWQFAFTIASSVPGIHTFTVGKIEPTDKVVTLQSPRRMCSVGSYRDDTKDRPQQQQQQQQGLTSKEEKLGILAPQISDIHGRVYSHWGTSTFLVSYGVLNACHESREAALWYAEFLLGNSHLPLYLQARNTTEPSTSSCITIDVAQDLLCLRPQWARVDPWGSLLPRYELDVLGELHVEKSGHAVTDIAMEWTPFMVAGDDYEEIAGNLWYQRSKIHPFLVELLAHLKRETFVETDYPLVEDKEDYSDDDDDYYYGDWDDDDNDSDDDSDDYDDSDNAFFHKDDDEYELFEFNRPFNRYYEFKGSFYLIDYRIQIDSVQLAELERCRAPDFVCGRKRYYKVAMGDRFFDICTADTSPFIFLNDLERAVLKKEYGDNIPVDMPSWAPQNPMDSFPGTVGCSMYVLACVETGA